MSMPNGRYPRECIDRLFELAQQEQNNQDNWACLLKNQLRLAGIVEDWQNRENLIEVLEFGKGILVRNYSDRLYALDIEAALKSLSSPHYKRLNPLFVIGEQLLHKVSFAKTRCVTQLRLATRNSFYVYNNRDLDSEMKDYKKLKSELNLYCDNVN
ncbi:hypothetical protein LSTR_LSTR003988 [Laodelphax striatellus]|uniref:Uncharacterized protein n=1 Tax=Laodelphax striatellus TaxID=195883 RepID=A0A482WEZ9_LAOST|nr:hypothetical protein LSTR_LSTR003988 [Laodelphax striatellus]